MVSVASVNVRAATPDDLPACLALNLSYETDYVWQVDVRGDESGAIAIGLRTARLPRLLRVTYPRAESLLSAALSWESTAGAFLVAEKGGVLRGYAILRFVRERSAAQIAELGVDAAARRQKIGTALLNAAYAQARAHKLRHLSIEVQTKNYPAICFCQRNGLVFCGYNDLYFANGDIALFFGQTVRL
ncbi:MAG: GNAT family N-acetyltransferase [Chloroflexi bacterium]|nr:GNAT family N-acetyltransferase [Chloroflexota bacterium]